MMGLKTWTRLRAMIARRERRISSSLLPENIGPQITSIQPRLPVTKSIDKPCIDFLKTAPFGRGSVRFGSLSTVRYRAATVGSGCYSLRNTYAASGAIFSDHHRILNWLRGAF